MNTPLGQVALTRIGRWVDAVLAPERADDRSPVLQSAATSSSGASPGPALVVRRYLEEVVNRGDLAALQEVWAPDGQWHGGSMGDRHGLEEMIAFAAGGGAGAFSEMHLTVHDVVAAGDKVVVRFTNSDRHTGPFLGTPATDRHASWLGIGLYTVTGREDHRGLVRRGHPRHAAPARRRRAARHRRGRTMTSTCRPGADPAHPGGASWCGRHLW